MGSEAHIGNVGQDGDQEEGPLDRAILAVPLIGLLLLTRL